MDGDHVQAGLGLQQRRESGQPRQLGGGRAGQRDVGQRGPPAAELADERGQAVAGADRANTGRRRLLYHGNTPYTSGSLPSSNAAT